MSFVTVQQPPKPGAENEVRIVGRSSGRSAATIKRRLAAVSSSDGKNFTFGDAPYSGRLGGQGFTDVAELRPKASLSHKVSSGNFVAVEGRMLGDAGVVLLRGD
jgi:hypothetical protein